MNWDIFFNEDGTPKETAQPMQPKSEWMEMDKNGNLHEIDRRNLFESMAKMPVPIYWYDPEYVPGRCHLRMPDGTLKDVTPR